MSRHHTTASSLASIFGGTKGDWSQALFGVSHIVGYPERGGGTAWTEELRVLRAIAMHLGPVNCLEVGVFQGESLRAVRAGWTPERHIAVDFDANCANHCPEGVEFRLGSCRQVANVVTYGFEFDFCFLDAEHTKEGVLETLRGLDRIARGRAVIVVHDQDPETCEGVRDRDGVQEFATKQEVRLTCPRCDARWVVPWGGRGPEMWICRGCGPQLAYELRPDPEVKWQWDELETPARLAILQRRW